MTKQELRRAMRQRKATYTEAQLESFSRQICQSIAADGLWRSASTVLFYNALPDEVSLAPLMQDTFRLGKCVLLPVVLDDTRMELRRFSPETPMCEGAFHIMEPQGEAFADFERIELALVPGMAFDVHGHRLGRGKGYYDRLLPQLRAHLMGVCFPFQLLEEIPVDAHDVPVHEVVCQ